MVSCAGSNQVSAWVARDSSGSKDVFNTKDQRVTHSLSGPGSPGGSPPKQRIGSFGKQSVIRWRVTPLQGCRVVHLVTTGREETWAQEVPSHTLGTSVLNQRLSWAPLASLGEH